MAITDTLRGLDRLPLVRKALVVLGCLLMALAPLAGAVPGPGGIFVFAAGLSLALKYSEWAKRLYVRFKKRYPNKGRWADWGLRRESARRREALRKADMSEDEAGDAASAKRRTLAVGILVAGAAILVVLFLVAGLNGGELPFGIRIAPLAGGEAAVPAPR
jgi:hypothetical protein